MKNYYVETLKEIQRREQNNELPPFMKDLALAVLGNNNPSSISNALNALERQGLITRGFNEPRSTRLTDKGRAFLKAQNNER